MSATYLCDRCGVVVNRPYDVDFFRAFGLESRRANLCAKCAKEFAEWCGISSFVKIIEHDLEISEHLEVTE